MINIHKHVCINVCIQSITKMFIYLKTGYVFKIGVCESRSGSTRGYKTPAIISIHLEGTRSVEFTLICIYIYIYIYIFVYIYAYFTVPFFVFVFGFESLLVLIDRCKELFWNVGAFITCYGAWTVK